MTIKQAQEIFNQYPPDTELRIVSHFRHHPVLGIRPCVDMDTQIVSLDVNYQDSYSLDRKNCEWVKEN